MDDIPSIWGIFYQTNIKLTISDDPQAISHKSDPIETSSVHTPNQAGQYVNLLATWNRSVQQQ